MGLGGKREEERGVGWGEGGLGRSFQVGCFEGF